MTRVLSPDEQFERCRSERDFLARRMDAELAHQRPRCYGVSSNALARWALGRGVRPRTPGHPTWPDGCAGGDERGFMWTGAECGEDYPHDGDDLRACELTYEMAPAHLRERMKPVLLEFWCWVVLRLNRHEAAELCTAALDFPGSTG